VYSKTKPDGTLALHLMAPDGSGDRCLVDTDGPDSWPAWSPDGEWVAFVGGDAKQRDLFVIRADGSDLTRVTDTALLKSHPVWSPDGKRLGYSASRGEDSPPSIHVARLDGSGDVVIPSGSGRTDLQDWSPDGNTLLYIRGSSEGGDGALWAMAPDGSERRLLRSEEGDFGSGAQYSPDGTQIAFQADLNGGCIYRTDPNAQTLTRLTTGCNQGGTLSWSPDGTHIITAGGDHGPRDAVVMTANGADQHPITSVPDAAYVDWRPSSTP
jgi:TolB protein